jgi:GTP-binding protein
MTEPANRIPRLAIVGRPNVGKSSLLNMLAGAKVSIVDATPGVTRDRVTSLVELTGPLGNEPPRLVEVTDTGGYGVYVAEGARFDDAGEDLQQLTDQIEAQIAAATVRADLILFVIDAQSGVTALDQTVAQLLRERAQGDGARQVPIHVVANKVDADKWEAHAFDAASLGFGEPLIVSAKTNFHRRHFVESLFELTPEPESIDDAESAEPEMRLAIVGKRNAGKSTLVNTLAGEERCIVSEIAGTTRDAIDVRFDFDGRVCTAIDTAGLRKRTKMDGAVEHFAFRRALGAIARADVCLLLIDATQRITAVDKRLGARVADEFKPCVIVISKWDLTEGRKNRKGEPVSPEDFQKYIEKEMPGLSHCPIVFTSSVTNQGIRESIDIAFELHEQARQRVPTARLNQMMTEILARRGPSSKLGTQAKVLYVSQVDIAPPTIVMIVNKPELFKSEYERYLLNRLRESTPFEEVPIRLVIRARRQSDDPNRAAHREAPELGKKALEVDEDGFRVIPAFDPTKR